MSDLVLAALIVVSLAAIAILSAWWGAEREKRKEAERTALDRSRDADIAAHPFEPDPLDRMRRKG
jgi:hypothetical protein